MNIPSGHYRFVLPKSEGLYVQSVKIGNASSLSGQFIISNSSRIHIEVNVSADTKVITGQIAGWDSMYPHAYVVAKNDLTGEASVAETDHNGRFLVKNLAPGEYDLYAWTSLQGIAYQTRYGLRRYEGDKITVSTDDSALNEVVVPLSEDGR